MMKIIPTYLTGLKKAELIKIIDEIPNACRPKNHVDPKTNAERRAFIDECRRRSREQLYADAQKPKQPPSLCRISAPEINAWLQSLPTFEGEGFA